MWDDSERRPVHTRQHRDDVWTEHDHDHGRRQPPTPQGAVAGFVLIILMAIIFAAVGAPGVMIGFMILMAIVSLVGGLAASEKEAQRARHAAWEREAERERLVEDVTLSVRESMKGTIKVRCRYCGSLSDEKEEKCESCGAPL